ncbi:MAG: hypothetical protein HFE82_08180 [Erysipelotrichaceae bacterium]|nr:hypothetical protein [Erysipelotrichaceae bacterium]
MKKTQMIALCIIILFAIDFSISQLLHISLLYERILDWNLIGKLIAFMIGISGFYSILMLGKQDD